MKKLALLFSMITLVFMSCSSDDDNGGSSDNDIVGTWKFLTSFENGVEEEPDLCDTEETLVFSANGDFTSTYYEEIAGNCAIEDTEDGTWSNSGNVYSITVDGETESVEVDFEGNTFSVEFVENAGGVTYTYRQVYEKQ